MAQLNVYECDRCKKLYRLEDKIILDKMKDRFISRVSGYFIQTYAAEHVLNTGQFQGEWDLCPECAGKLVEWLYEIKHQNEDAQKNEKNTEKDLAFKVSNCDKCVWQYNKCSGQPINGHCPEGVKYKRDPPDGGYYG